MPLHPFPHFCRLSIASVQVMSRKGRSDERLQPADSIRSPKNAGKGRGSTSGPSDRVVPIRCVGASTLHSARCEGLRRPREEPWRSFRSQEQDSRWQATNRESSSGCPSSPCPERASWARPERTAPSSGSPGHYRLWAAATSRTPLRCAPFARATVCC